MEARNAWFEANSDQLNDNGERLIIKDNLDSQIYGPNVNMSDAYGVTDWYVPEGNTDGLQAVDDGAGNGVKVEINNMFEDWLDIDENGTIEAKEFVHCFYPHEYANVYGFETRKSDFFVAQSMILGPSFNFQPLAFLRRRASTNEKI